jgi:pilus assembly protein CpaB
MRRWRGPIILATAAVLALITSLLVHKLVQQKETDGKALLMEPVVVAAKDLSWGTSLTSDMVKVIHLPKENLADGCYGNVDDVKDRVLVTRVVADEPILASKLAPIGSKAGLSGIIKENKRAMSVRVDEVIGVAGFIYPGSNVDVLVTIRPRGEIKEPTTNTILQNVPVLAAGTKMDVGEGETVRVSVVTLEVSPEEAEKLALAATEGKIRLAMRNSIDDSFAATKGVGVSGLVRLRRGVSVEIIRGSKVSKHTL